MQGLRRVWDAARCTLLDGYGRTRPAGDAPATWAGIHSPPHKSCASGGVPAGNTTGGEAVINRRCLELTGLAAGLPCRRVGCGRRPLSVPRGELSERSRLRLKVTAALGADCRQLGSKGFHAKDHLIDPREASCLCGGHWLARATIRGRGGRHGWSGVLGWMCIRGSETGANGF
jgi:hypothetical protein